MSASCRSPTFGRTILLGRFHVCQTVVVKVASHGHIVAVPDDGIDSTDCVGRVECVGFGDQSIFHPTGASVVGEMSAAIG